MAGFSSGVYTRTYDFTTLVAGGTKVDAARMDTELDAIATALSSCLLKDGTQTVSANIPMNTKKFTGLDAGTASGDSVRYEQVGLLAVANTFTADQTIRSADAGAGQGPALTLDRNSASPADNDLLGQMLFTGRNDAAETTTYSRILIQATDVTDGTEDGKMYLQTLANGTITTGMTLEGAAVAIPGTLELGHASDTTLARASAGNLSVEGNIIYRAGGTDVPEGDGGTGASTFQAAADNILGGAATSTGTPTYVVVMESGVAKQITLANFIQKALGTLAGITFFEDGVDRIPIYDSSTSTWKYATIETNNADFVLGGATGGLGAA